MPTETLAQRVARGVALLDSEAPGWRERVNHDRLDMASRYDCLLGQLWYDNHHDDDHSAFIRPPFDRAKHALGLVDGEAAADHGFDIYETQQLPYAGAFGDLHQAWVDVLAD